MQCNDKRWHQTTIINSLLKQLDKLETLQLKLSLVKIKYLALRSES